MGYALPAGITNTDSVIFYANITDVLGTMVKDLGDQTLVLIDYSQIIPALTLQSYSFTVDVSSNPALVISFPEIDTTNTVLKFLLSGGLTGQDYNINIVTMTTTGTRLDMLAVNVPSSEGPCNRIIPMPPMYTVLPLGTRGYVNSGVRFFWGNTPPTNPNILDQWLNTDTEVLSEWITDGTAFSWKVLA